MASFVNLEGKSFGRYTVIKRTGRAKNNTNTFWLCRCRCGIEKKIRGFYLIHGATQSCGCHRRIDISGKRFGMLTVVRPTKYRSRRALLWLCACDCGKKTLVQARCLRAKLVISCGCFRRGERSARMIDIAGQVFGRLTAVRPDERCRGHWVCKCECGNECSVRGTALRDLHTKSCGCFRGIAGRIKRKPRNDLVGKVFGRLGVIGGPHGTGNQKAWQCQCSCGNIKWIVQRSLIGNNTKSCGCGQFAPLTRIKSRTMVGARRIADRLSAPAE